VRPSPGRDAAAPRAVLFDLDGTLVDTGPDIAVAVNSMLEDMGRPTHDRGRIMGWIGEGAVRLVQRALAGGVEGQAPAQETERGLSLFYDYYAARVCVDSRPYSHVEPVLAALRRQGVRLACVTNKPVRHTRLLLDALSLAYAFDVVVGGDTLAQRKPDPEPLRFACRRLAVDESNAVYVGDSMTDCRAAAGAGMAMVLVSYGYNRGADLTRLPCAAIIHSLGELPETLQEIQHRQ